MNQQSKSPGHLKRAGWVCLSFAVIVVYFLQFFIFLAVDVAMPYPFICPLPIAIFMAYAVLSNGSLWKKRD